MLDSIFVSVLNMSLVASYVTLFVLIVRLLLQKAPKIFSYALWSVVLVRLLCPFSFESAIGLLPSNTEIVSSSQDFTNDTAILELPTIEVPARRVVYFPESGVTANVATVIPIEFILGMLWVIGIAVMVVYSIVSLIKLRRKLIGATPLDKNIYIADHIDSPFVMGFIKPKIYLPSNLTDAERDFIIKHEQTHIKRLDHITRIFSFVALAVHWFNPLVWISFVLSGKDMETSCDELVMKKMNTDIRADYCEALLKFAAGRKLIHATPLAFGEGNTKGRVKNVMKYKRPMVWVSAICLILVSVIAVSLMSNQQQSVKSKTDTEILWSHRTEYIGNNTKVGNILSNLAFTSNVMYDKFELQTAQEPYELIIHLIGIENALQSSSDGVAWNVDFKSLEHNAAILFSLIGNVDKIEFLIQRDEGGTLTNHYLREDFIENFELTENYDDFLAFYETIFDEIADEPNNNMALSNEVIISEDITASTSVIDTVSRYAEDMVAYYNEIGTENNFKIIDAKITDLNPISTGTANNDYSINLYKLEYRLTVDYIDNVPLTNGLSIDNGTITEWTSEGQPYLLFYDDFNDDKDEIFIAMDYNNTIVDNFQGDEYLIEYATPYTAYAMETYNEFLNAPLL
ncbi:MAG: M56 family metallopeptidase [Eubacteriales bacterium]